MDDSDTDTGLAFEPGDGWEPDIVRSEAEALTPLVPDLGSRAVFAPEPKIDFGGVGEQFKPPDGDLQIGTDGDRLRDDLAKLKEHAADLKLRALLDKAERAMRAGRLEEAWTHVEAALKIAPSSVPALLLGARCQHALGAHESALDLLATARQHAQGADEVTLVVRLRGTCELGLIKEVDAYARELLRCNRASAAVEFVQTKVARHPGILELRFILGAVLFQIGHLTEARDVIEAVLATDEAAGIDAFPELHRSILSKLYAPKVEMARQSLRAGQPKAAIDQLAVCGDALQANPRHERLWSYAHERYAKSSKVPFVGWRRARRADVTPLDVNGLQETLMWLLSEEVDATMEAFRKSDLDSASRYCAHAEAIDSRCGAVAYLHAMAEMGAATVALKKIDLSTLAVAERHLAFAARLVSKVGADPELTDKANILADKITADRAEVARLTRFVSCISRFTTLTRRYERRHIVTRNELRAVRVELRSIRSAAQVSKREHEPDSPAQQTLDKLIGAIETTLRQRA